MVSGSNLKRRQPGPPPGVFTEMLLALLVSVRVAFKQRIRPSFPCSRASIWHCACPDRSRGFARGGLQLTGQVVIRVSGSGSRQTSSRNFRGVWSSDAIGPRTIITSIPSTINQAVPMDNCPCLHHRGYTTCTGLIIIMRPVNVSLPWRDRATAAHRNNQARYTCSWPRGIHLGWA